MQKLVLLALAGGAGTLLLRLGVRAPARAWRRGRGHGAQPVVGVMGGFTTFSSYMNDLVGLAGAERWSHLAFDFLLRNVGGIACCLAGIALGRLE